MTKAENILLFDVLFSILLLAYGVGTGIASAAIALPFPKLAPTPSSQYQNCQNTDAGCIASNLVLATSYIGWAIVNLPVLLVFFAGLFIGFGVVVTNLTFSPAFNGNGVPYLGFIFIGLQLYVFWEIVRTIRGSSAGV